MRPPAEAMASAPQRCPHCGGPGPWRCHAVREGWWRDVPAADDLPQIRRGAIVRWRCLDCGGTQSSQPAWALPGKRMTRALEAWIREALQQGRRTGAIARHCGLDDKTVRLLRRSLAPTWLDKQEGWR